jgi:hypothetical protein
MNDQLTKEQAVALYDSEFWIGMTLRERAEFQIHTNRLCMPFDVFHEAVEKTLSRPVFTHEFGLNRDGIVAELAGECDPPSFAEIVDLIPEEKRILLVIP